MSELYDIFRRHPRISTDTRRIEPGSVFFALHGATFDGNRFAADALSKGAAYAVVDDPAAVSGDRTVLVGDTLEALQELAREYRRELAIPILAISGSNGKTTTKELVSRVLAERFEVYATHGNLNNHIGVPLTLLAMTRDTEFGVVEMGVRLRRNRPAGVYRRTQLRHPDQHRPRALKDSAARRAFAAARASCWLSGRERRPRLRPARRPNADQHGREPTGWLRNTTRNTGRRHAHHLEGDYNRFNIAAAVAVGRYFDIDGERIRHAVGSYMPDNNRSQRTETERNTLIVDCYNANPSSMRASVLNFLAEPAGGRSRRVLILGDMLELGAWSEQEHRDIVALAARNPDAELMLVGGEFARACAGMEPQPANTALFPSREELIAELRRRPVENAFVLVKGSRGIGLEKALEEL
ncbi:MAG: UDP-N-acetylmuramoyl-tripeptide--D-alanyl-D-alanine ligase [Alistipes finegoldii]